MKEEHFLRDNEKHACGYLEYSQMFTVSVHWCYFWQFNLELNCRTQICRVGIGSIFYKHIWLIIKKKKKICILADYMDIRIFYFQKSDSGRALTNTVHNLIHCIHCSANFMDMSLLFVSRNRKFKEDETETGSLWVPYHLLVSYRTTSSLKKTNTKIIITHTGCLNECSIFFSINSSTSTELIIDSF